MKTFEQVELGVAEFENIMEEYAQARGTRPSDHELTIDLLHILPGELSELLLTTAASEGTSFHAFRDLVTVQAGNTPRAVSGLASTACRPRTASPKFRARRTGVRRTRRATWSQRSRRHGMIASRRSPTAPAEAVAARLLRLDRLVGVRIAHASARTAVALSVGRCVRSPQSI